MRWLKNVRQKSIAFILIAAGSISGSFGQTNKELALEKTREAVKLMDMGMTAASIELLEEAKQLDPEDILYSYEIGLAHCLDKNYDKAIAVLTKLRKHKDVHAQVYQLLGNSYSLGGDSKKAIKTYEEGLKKFPDAGNLYLERGNMEVFIDELGNAMAYYEKGIEVDPTFPSNYYHACRLYCLYSEEEVWGMIYGELFMNLERSGSRTEEISKLLYDTYKQEIKIAGDSTSVSFSKNNTVYVNPKDLTSIRMPFGLGVYEPTLIFALIEEKEVNLESLCRIRTRFLEQYYKKEYNKRYPNALFDYQNKVLAAGYMNAYNHWILMKGDVDASEMWYLNNREEWDAFLEWFTENPIALSKDNRFYRRQY